MKPVRLLPQGTAREAFLRAHGRMPEPTAADPRLPDSLANAVANYDLDDGLLYEVWEILRCAPKLDPSGQAAMAYLVAACLVSARRGSTRLPIDPARFDPVLSLVNAGRGERAWLRGLLTGKKVSRASVETILGEAGESKPLILEDGYLYLHRLRDAEQRLAERLRARMDTRVEPPDGLGDAFGAVLDRPAKAAGQDVRLSGEQERAVLSAFHLAVAVVTGGPGTGKTSIVVTLLRTLARLGVPLESIALAAPTGKAANRMEQSIRKALSSIEPLDGPDRELLERCPAPRTLHRLLGYSPSGDRFRHHENNPLSERVVVVDECSMVDLFLMDRLLRAVDPKNTRLILLGDAEQLPSVEAGAVFRDLVPEKGPAAKKPWDALVRSALPEPGPAGAKGDPRARCAVRLTRSYRQDDKDPEGRQILEVAALVNQSRAEDLLSAVSKRASAAEVRFQGVELVPAATAEEREAMLERWFQQRVLALDGLQKLVEEPWRLAEGKARPEQRARLEALCAHYERSRILCATRGEARPTGAAAVNASIRSRWLKARGIPEGAQSPRWAWGEPVMAERNDYVRGLFNGDQGLVLQVAEGEGPAGTRALFGRRDSWAALPLDADSGLSRCFAMTVHKAQGSEFDAVLLVLPEEDIPLLTREILYTAITRARKSVVILGQ
ncbi:MAG TPA: exodeoxyribonuclease V subunit alpha, partial [Myxococcales bacterium]